jgi:hypothetical protein
MTNLQLHLRQRLQLERDHVLGAGAVDLHDLRGRER